MSKYGPEKTPCLDTFHAVNNARAIIIKQIMGNLENVFVGFHRRTSGVFIVNFEHTQHLFLVFLWFTLNK